MEREELERRARRLGAQPRYRDWTGTTREVGTETLRAVVDALDDDPPPGGATSPLVVAGPAAVPVAPAVERAVIVLDPTLPLDGAGGAERELVVAAGSVVMPPDLPIGVHQLRLLTGRSERTRFVLRRPPPRPVPPWLVGTWGLFAPLHGLRTAVGDRGVGTVGQLAELGRAMAPWSPRLLAVLPLFAIDPTNPSPYSPVSQHFWNEAHLDLGRLAHHLGVAPPPPSPADVAARRRVDWPAVTAEVHRALDRMLDELGDTDPAGLLPDSGLDRAELDAYCAFRAGDDGRARARHRLAQLAMDQQLATVASELAALDQGLMLDLPVGTSDTGFDVTHQADLYLADWSIGAPPDQFFRLGQRWGLPPIHPGRSSASGHDHVGRSVATVARHARAVRIDHVMGLERLWWVPPGVSADQGVYVTQPSAELAARLAIEVHRTGVAVIGENLGTVPPTTARLLTTEGMLGMYEELFAVGGLSAGGRLPEVPGPVAAGTGTHDMPSFAGFIAGTDIALLEALQGFSPEATAELAAERRADVEAWARLLSVPPRAPALLAATLDRLGRSAAAHVVVGVEDLWSEIEPLNIPGTGPEHGNWRRRMRLDLDRIGRSPSVARLLDTVVGARAAAARTPRPDGEDG